MDGMSLAWMLAAGSARPGPASRVDRAHEGDSVVLASCSKSAAPPRGIPERASRRGALGPQDGASRRGAGGADRTLLAALMGLGVGLATFPPSGVVVILPVLAIGLLGTWSPG